MLLTLGSNTYANNYNFAFNGKEIVNVIEKRVQINPDLFLGLDGYYALGESINVEKQAELDDGFKALVDENRKLQAKLDVLIQILSGGATPAPTPAPNEGSEPVTPTQPPVEPKNTLNDQVYKLFKQQCFVCHKTNANGLQLFNEDGTGLADLSLSDAVTIHHRTEGIVLHEGETLMPKGKQPLSADEMKLVKRWLFEKAIAN